MKNISSTSTTTTLSSSKPAAAAEEDRDSCYFPGCRKDANCSCEICIASINATLDLMPISIQKSSLTKLSTASRPAPDRAEVTPISFGSLSTPTSRSTRLSPLPPPPPQVASPCLRSSARINPKEKTGKVERESGFGGGFCRVVLALGLIFAAEFGFSWGVSGALLKPAFSSDAVRNVGERSWAVKGLDEKLRFLQRSLQSLVVDGKISNCSYANSRWEISQYGLLLNSHCNLYKSSMEEIRIWGWPLQTAGLLVTGFSSRSFTVISGRVTEWPDGKVGFVTWTANSSWTHRKWGSSAVQFDPNTWILEYWRSSILENPRLVSATMAFLKHRVSKMVGQMKQVFWLFSAFGKSQYYHFAIKSNVQVPPT